MSEPRGKGAVLKRRVLGVGFIVLVVGLIALSIAGQQHAFRDVITVQLQTDQVGNQLTVKSDVKARGVIIGHVGRITPTPEGATLELRLDPVLAAEVPKASSARLLPKTLFGERYVQLYFDTLVGPKLAHGDVITQDRTTSARELYAAFDKLLPVLQAVRPEKLNATLTAIADALDGQGREIGETLADAGALAGELKPHLAELQQAVDELADFSGDFAEVVPELANTLQNLRTPARTLVEKRRGVETLVSTLTTASQDLEEFLAANQDNIITVGAVTKPTLRLLAKYSPAIPCVVNQMARATPILNQALGVGTGKPGLRAKARLIPTQQKYLPGQDEVEFNLMGKGGYTGPWCMDPLHPDIPSPFPYPYRMLRTDDGSNPQPDVRSELDGKGLPCGALDIYGNEPPQAWLKECAPGTYPDGSGIVLGDRSKGGGSSNPSNSPEENQLLAYLLSVQTGMDPEQMPSWGSLLVGPLYRGAEVSFE